MKAESISGSLLDKAHDLVGECLHLGATAVDATLGNGHDALFLAKCVGVTGKLIGFDIQLAAIDAAKQRLTNASFDGSTFQLFCESHDHMARRVSAPTNAVMFNLGYLPGADKTIITDAETTLKALDQAYQILAAKGIMTVMCYPGHAGGDTESERVYHWFQAKDQTEGVQVSHISREGASKTSPFLLTLFKRE